MKLIDYLFLSLKTARQGFFFIGTLLVCLFWIASGEAELQKIEVKLDQKKLDAGKIQTFTQKLDADGKRKRVVGVMLIDAPVPHVWAVLEDWEAMGEFVDSLEYYKTVKVLKPVGENRVGESLIEGLLKVAFIKIHYTLKVTFDEQNLRQEWRLVRANKIPEYGKQNIKVNKSSAILKNIEGFGYIEPYKEGKTIYYYAPIVEVSGPIPGWAERKISKSSLREYMKGVKKQAEQMK